MTKWIEQSGPDGDIIISSRIRLARNLQEYPFPVALTKGKSKEVIKKVGDVILEGNTVLKHDFLLQEMESQSALERQVLMEKHLISPNLMENHERSAVLLNKDESVSIMINEEDHIRIQCLLPGLQLTEAWDTADKLDDVLEESLHYAFDEQLGYLTSCPTNVGTGIRASVMVHLPALSMTGYINRVLQAANQIGLAVRGLYGEGTEFVGNVFQISNQITLGRSEEEIIANLKDVTRQIVQKERDARSTLLNSNRLGLEDKIYRSYGILSNARILTSQEFMTLLSDLRLGVDLAILENVKIEGLNQLMVMTQPGCLQKSAAKNLSAHERDVRRAAIVREKLGSKG
ncbi:protein arginine kinase [Geosporobacter subterraneus DSM 17957]|uniref:Protein-arginine kinase n=1 Tax=Geosporobacter subterraneus DSM 17957 TaxID=1121919 RepID=A0A1M6IPB7_9FIRM|nr:protein arginine kinase [Geosporobacter subterraneus]SHJ36286.1 protein arginine kinase [Geosporobacter subterraneus DSM 17957]